MSPPALKKTQTTFIYFYMHLDTWKIGRIYQNFKTGYL